MSEKNSLARKFSISTIANFIALLVSVFSTIVFPKVLSIEDYSYWQTYVFYIGFVTIAGFGWIEGVYLRYGGKTFDSLDRSLFSFVTYGLFVFTTVIFVAVGILSYLFISDKKLSMVIILVAIEGVAYNMRSLPIYVMQATDRIKEFSIATVLGRGVFFLGALLLIILGYDTLYSLIWCDIIGIICCTTYGFVALRTKLIGKPCGIIRGIKETKENMHAGFSLLSASMVGVLITGVIKYSIQSYWSIIEFGKVALTITCTNVFLRFSVAVGTVLFPMLCNYSIDRLKSIYKTFNSLLEYMMGIVFVFYYPLKLLFALYLPQYSESLLYMDYLLPICLFETKVSLLLNTYYKAMRKEKALMIVNTIVLAISFILAFVCSFVFSNLFMAVLSILVVLALRSIILEVVLSKKYLQLKEKLPALFSTMIAVAFVVCNGVIGGIVGMLSYAILAIATIFINRNKIINCIKLITKNKKAI